MKSAMRWTGLLTLLVLAPGSGALPAPPGSPKLEVPDGWRTEDTTYPPPWAKTLPWKGNLQIRFPAGWFDDQSPYYWSYPVLYWLEGDVLSSREDLEKALWAYDAGLYAGKFDGAKIKIVVEDEQKEEILGHNVIRRSISIQGFDPFVSMRELATHLQVFRWQCPESQRTAVLILRSPRPYRKDDLVWRKLLTFRAKIACHPSATKAQPAKE